MSETHLAYCGFNCAECPIYQATAAHDDDLRQRVAEKYNLDTEKMHCSGCRTELENKFLCGCAMRCCAEKKALDTCAACKSYPCNVIERSLPKESAGRARLDGIK
jgi:hypothetical protein